MKEIKKLENAILKHKALYYQGRAEISDHEYDALEEKLKKIDPENPVLSLVGTRVTNHKKIAHEKKMLSLNKTYKEDELIKWIDGRDVVSTFKIDGSSCSLIYKNGKLTFAKTRGDGSFGENITEKAHWIPSIPKTVDDGDLEIRGEIYCDEASFFHLSEEMGNLGLEKPKSQRNIVAGLIGRKENIELARHLNFCAFEMISNDNKVKTEWDKFKKLKELGFELPKIDLLKKEKEIKRVIEETKDFMAEGEYLIDGIVFSLNDLSLHEEMGETAHHPRYKIAFKFQGISKKTIINEIIWNVSRNGILTPVADVEPVLLSGASISRVTLHNYGMVKQYNLKKGDEIEIVRSGEVIPKFLSVTKEGKNKFKIPSKCPSCQSEIIIDDIRIKCANDLCPAKNKESLLNFIQKIGIDDLSSKRLEEMLSRGVIKKIPDLYKLEVEDLLTLDKTKEKLANKLYESIQASKNINLPTFLSSLGINGGAYNKCEKVVLGGFDTIEKLKKMTSKNLAEVDSFAEKSATEFVNSLREKWPIVEDLLNLGFSFTKKESSGSLDNKKIVITGSLSRKRSDIEKDIRSAGGIISGSVSKATDFLVTNDGESGSSKAKKAKELKIKIITEEELYSLL